jgi:predicted O-methyltransferase YrrM
LEGIKKLLRPFIPSSGIRKWILRTGKWIAAYRSEFATFYPVGHFYSPLPSLEEVLARRQRIFESDPSECPGVGLNESGQLELPTRLAESAGGFDFPEAPGDSHRYYTDNNVFPAFDAAVLFAMLRYLTPRRVVEVGSGFSSALMLATAERHLEQQPAFTFVEPDPQRLYSLIRGDRSESSRIVEREVQDLDLEIVEELESGDIFFVDSSHVLKIGSDVNHILFEMLPRLARGVVVHFHDIRWPFEYPREWVELGRAWNEAYALRAFLQYNDAFEIIFFNAYMQARHPDELASVFPSVDRTHGGSLWLRKRL